MGPAFDFIGDLLWVQPMKWRYAFPLCIHHLTNYYSQLIQEVWPIQLPGLQDWHFRCSTCASCSRMVGLAQGIRNSGLAMVATWWVQEDNHKCGGPRIDLNIKHGGIKGKFSFLGHLWKLNCGVVKLILSIFEGSLEVKLPTIWRDESRAGQRHREEED